MSPPAAWARSWIMPEDSSDPQHTPPDDRVLRRAADQVTQRLLDGAVQAQAEIGGLRANVVHLTSAVDALRESSSRVELGLGQLVALQTEANRQRAEELAEARAARAQREAAAAHVSEVEAADKVERARWWRSLVEPRTVGLVLLAVVLWLLGQGALIPSLLPPRAP